jgi:delta14-sterol reductase
VFLTILLIHRAKRDEEKCIAKYGDDYRKYMKLVPYKIIPGIY